MENKYYTPKPQEICLDFEIERYFKHASNWVKGYVTLHTISEDIDSVYGVKGMNWMVDGVDQNHPTCHTRVKILDEQDILDCGWLDLNTQGTKTFKKYLNLEILEDVDWFNALLIMRVRLLNNKTHLSIRKFYINTYEEEDVNNWENIKKEYIFQGEIKNKSEFIKLLQQLEIPQKQIKTKK